MLHRGAQAGKKDAGAEGQESGQHRVRQAASLVVGTRHVYVGNRLARGSAASEDAL
jgi:hypothetical protein